MPKQSRPVFSIEVGTSMPASLVIDTQASSSRWMPVKSEARSGTRGGTMVACAEHDKLLLACHNATLAFSDAVSTQLGSTAFSTLETVRLRNNIQSARLAMENAHYMLGTHRRKCGC